MELDVAGARVVDDRVAVDVVERPLFRYEARRLSDDHAELHLPVERLLATGTEDGLAAIEDGVVPLGEDRRLLGNGAARLRRVVLVVEPYADELARVIDGRVETHRVGGVADRLELARLGRFHHGPEHLLGGRAAFEEAPGALGKQGARNGGRADDALRREPVGAARLEIYDAVLTHVAAQARRMAVLREPDDLH